MEALHRAGYGRRGMELWCPLWAHHPPSTSVVHQPGMPPSRLSCRDFYGGIIMWPWLNHNEAWAAPNWCIGYLAGYLATSYQGKQPHHKSQWSHHSWAGSNFEQRKLFSQVLICLLHETSGDISGHLDMGFNNSVWVFEVEGYLRNDKTSTFNISFLFLYLQVSQKFICQIFLLLPLPCLQLFCF